MHGSCLGCPDPLCASSCAHCACIKSMANDWRRDLPHASVLCCVSLSGKESILQAMLHFDRQPQTCDTCQMSPIAIDTACRDCAVQHLRGRVYQHEHRPVPSTYIRQIVLSKSSEYAPARHPTLRERPDPASSNSQLRHGSRCMRLPSTGGRDDAPRHTQCLAMQGDGNWCRIPHRLPCAYGRCLSCKASRVSRRRSSCERVPQTAGLGTHRLATERCGAWCMADRNTALLVPAICRIQHSAKPQGAFGVPMREHRYCFNAACNSLHGV